MKIKKSTYVFVFGLFFCAIFFGAGLGLALSNTKFIKDNEQKYIHIKEDVCRSPHFL